MGNNKNLGNQNHGKITATQSCLLGENCGHFNENLCQPLKAKTWQLQQALATF
jgi:hypothetical protein